MSIDLELVKADPKLVLTPHLMEEAEKGSLSLSLYAGLLLKDLAEAVDPYNRVISLANEGNVALARRLVSESNLNETEITKFEETCSKIYQDTYQLALAVDKQIAQHRDDLDPTILSNCVFLQSEWQKAIKQERYHTAQRELITIQNILADEKNFRSVDYTAQLLETTFEIPVLAGVFEKAHPDEALGEDRPEQSLEEVTLERSTEVPGKIAGILKPIKQRNVLNEAVNIWTTMTSTFSRPLKDLIRPTDKVPQISSLFDVSQSMKRIQRSQGEWQQEVEDTLKQYFYLTEKDRQQLEESFYHVLMVYASEQLRNQINYGDFDSANQIFSDIIQLIRDYPKLSHLDQLIFNLYRHGIEARAAAAAKNTGTSFKDFEQAHLIEIRSSPWYISKEKNETLINLGKVLFFYRQIQVFRKAKDFDSLIQFYTEYHSPVATLVKGDIELNRLYEATKNDYNEALYRKTESTLTELHLPPEMGIENTLAFIRQLPPYQIVSVLKNTKKRFASDLTRPAQSLTQMYSLMLMLFDMQKPEELVFTEDEVSNLIKTLRGNAEKNRYIYLVPESERLHLGVLDELETFVQKVVAAASVTDFVLVRQHIAQALECLQKQREYLQAMGPASGHLWHTLGDHWISILVTRQRAMSRQTSLHLTLYSEEILADQESPLIIYVKNTGPGFAQNVEVALTSSDLSIKEPTIRMVSILKNGDEYALHFSVEPRVSGRHAEVRLLIRYVDVVNSPIITSENRVLVLKNIGRKMIPQKSPYVWGHPLKKGTKVFYGRGDVFDFLQTRFWGKERNKIIALQGERRMGKTSILHQLKARKIFGNYRVVYFDFQARYANINSIPEFLFHFARRITSEAGLRIKIQVDRSHFRLGYQEEYDVFETWLDRVEEELEKRDTQIVIVFDEFEKLLGRRFDDHINVNKRLVEDLLQYLRSVMLVRERFNWIIAGSWSLIAKQREYFSSLFGMALSYWVSYLKRDDAITLIQEPVKEYLTYDQAATERILLLTGGHPFHIQIICDELFNNARERNTQRITAYDVNSVIDHTLRQVTEANFRMIWTSLDSSISRKVLAAVAGAMQEPRGFVYKDQVFKYLRRKSPRQGEEPFYAVLDMESGELMRRELLEAHPVVPERVRIRSELLYRWLRKAKPLTTVLREER